MFIMYLCLLSCSSSIISRGRGSSWSPEPGSTLPKLQVHSATSTPCTSCTGKHQSCSAPLWISANMTSAKPIHGSAAVTLNLFKQRPEAWEHPVGLAGPHRPHRLWPLQRRSGGQQHNHDLLRDAWGTKLIPQFWYYHFKKSIKSTQIDFFYFFPYSTWLLRSCRSKPTTAPSTGGVWDPCSTRCSTDW